MAQAELMARRSTCAKLKVGAVLVRDNRTISQGYNGVGENCRHCYDYWHDMYKLEESFETFDDFLADSYFRTEHKKWTVNHELHAEQNCILWAAREGISTKNTTLYTIYSPCINCAKVIHSAGIIEVYYKNMYSDINGIDYLNKNNIIAYKI
jgi:dCMP deaminase